jgi:hypothetical protein
MGNQVMHTQAADLRWSWLYKVSGLAAMMAGILLLIGILSLISTVLSPASTSGWLSRLPNNWLIVIFKLHAGFGGAQIGLLDGLELLDIAILALAGVMYVGLYTALWRTSRIWSIVAAIQPFLGIVLFVGTKTAGRSAAMGAGLVISLVMLRSRVFKKATACLGVAASLCLLIGDFSAGIPPSAVIATVFGVAYILFIIWFFRIARGLSQLGNHTKG